MVCNIKRRTQTEDVRKQGAEENVWTHERWNNRKLEKTA
jgi:hypothetical protein